jgi:hypothetical protein
MVIYELAADDAQGDQDQRPEGFRALDQGGNQSEGHAVHASREVARLHRVQTRVTDCGVPLSPASGRRQLT